MYFLPFLEAGSLKSGCQHGQVLVRAVFLAFTWLPFCCVFTWQREREREREREKTQALVSVPLIVEAPPSWPHVTALNLPVSKYHHTGAAASRCEIWSDINFNPYQVFWVCIFCLRFILAVVRSCRSLILIVVGYSVVETYYLNYL